MSDETNTAPPPHTSIAMRFAEILSLVGQRLHVGCIMAAGVDWVEVSLPQQAKLDDQWNVRFPPAEHVHTVAPAWRTLDRVGLVYLKGGPGYEQFAGITGLWNALPALMRARQMER